MFTFLWPRLPPGYDRQPEAMLWFETAGGRALQLASNFPYEVYVDGQLVGDGGHRCVKNEAYIDEWDAARAAQCVSVRLHWLNPLGSSVYHRCLFEDPFLAVAQGTESAWTCRLDASVVFAARTCTQLPRQNFLVAPLFVNAASSDGKMTFGISASKRNGADYSETHDEGLPLVTVQRHTWNLVPLPVARCHYVDLGPLAGGKVRPLPPDRQGSAEANKRSSFQPRTADDLLLYVLHHRERPLECVTYDLGAIGLHRFQVTTTPGSDCVLCYSEVPDFTQAWATSNRRKVHLADGCAAGVDRPAAPFGTRGCRYVHVVYTEAAQQPRVQAWRREYPFAWRTDMVPPDPQLEPVLAACRHNLVAVCDGGLVDTCWRERAQWTGDLRMSAKAIRALTQNPEVVRLALSQVAHSYDAKVAMVSGCGPARTPDYHLAMPTFHLAFCLTVLEHCGVPPASGGSDDEMVKRLHHVVQHSVHAWKNKYIHDGQLTKLPGWNFVDWDPADPDTVGRQQPGRLNGPNAVCHAWWQQVCTLLGTDSRLDVHKFDQVFWTGKAYRLMPGLPESPHATAAVLCAAEPLVVSTDRANQAYRYLDETIASGQAAERVTFYFGYFVAQALAKRSLKRALTFIQQRYGVVAKLYGTIPEKTNDNASLAHGWSIGMAEMLVRAKDRSDAKV